MTRTQHPDQAHLFDAPEHREDRVPPRPPLKPSDQDRVSRLVRAFMDDLRPTECAHVHAIASATGCSRRDVEAMLNLLHYKGAVCWLGGSWYATTRTARSVWAPQGR